MTFDVILIREDDDARCCRDAFVENEPVYCGSQRSDTRLHILEHIFDGSNGRCLPEEHGRVRCDLDERRASIDTVRERTTAVYLLLDLCIERSYQFVQMLQIVGNELGLQNSGRKGFYIELVVEKICEGL